METQYQTQVQENLTPEIALELIYDRVQKLEHHRYNGHLDELQVQYQTWSIIKELDELPEVFEQNGHGVKNFNSIRHSVTTFLNEFAKEFAAAQNAYGMHDAKTLMKHGFDASLSRSQF